jgi:hypothetical protein
VLVADFAGKFTIGNPSWLTEANGRLFVVATASHYGSEIWVAELPPPPAGDYNANSVADAADYVLWRHTLGSTTDLRANGDDSGASAGIIDQADYAVWRSHFGEVAAAAGSAAGGAGLGADGGAKSEERGASGDSVELGMGSGEVVEVVEGARSEERGASGAGLRSADFGLRIEDLNQFVVVGGGTPSPRRGEFRAPRTSLGGRGGISAAARNAFRPGGRTTLGGDDLDSRATALLAVVGRGHVRAAEVASIAWGQEDVRKREASHREAVDWAFAEANLSRRIGSDIGLDVS